MKKTMFICANIALVLQLHVVPEVSALPIYSNLGTNDSFRNSVHDVLNLNGAYVEHAAGFVVRNGPDFVLTSIELPITNSLPTNSQISLTIWTDTSGRPGDALETIVAEVLGQDGTIPVLQSIAFSGTTLLQGGNTYWLSAAATSPGRVAWFTNNTGVGRYGITYDPTHDPSTWRTMDDGLVAPQGAFRLNGEPSHVRGVPEPSSLLLFGSGLAMLAGWRRKQATF